MIASSRSILNNTITVIVVGFSLLFIISSVRFYAQPIRSSIYFLSFWRSQSRSDMLTKVVPSESNGNTLQKCNLYTGKWVYDPSPPLYNNSCSIIIESQNCRGNGRPDTGYENWRWKPDNCELPRFDVNKFLRLTANKSVGFVGDSLARNHMQSLLCILMDKEQRVRNHGFHVSQFRMKRWFFGAKENSSVVARIWSSYLVETTTEALGFAPEGILKVHLDVPDKDLMEFVARVDVVVVSSGHWFGKQAAYVINNSVVGGERWWPKDAGEMKVNSPEAMRISTETMLTAIANHPKFSGLVILRTYSPAHYAGGGWDSGGSCAGIAQPEREVFREGDTDMMHAKQIEGYQRAVQRLKDGGLRVRLMDVTEMMGYRRDGHPGPYRQPINGTMERRPGGRLPPQDCLHWCMPGAVDTWNEILLETLRREFEGKEEL